MKDGSEYIKQHSRLKQKKTGVLKDWQDIAKYVLPQLNEWSKEEAGKGGVAKQIYDGTAISAVQVMAFAMQGYFCSASIQWFNLELEGVTEEDTPYAVKEWLQKCTKHLYTTLVKAVFMM